jgi:hypothetical protein
MVLNFYLSRPRGTKTGIRIGTLENKNKNKKNKKIKIFLKKEELEKEPFFSFDFGELMQGVLKLSQADI